MAYLKSFVGLFMFYKSLYFRYYAMLSWQLDYLTRFNRLNWALATCGSIETESLLVCWNCGQSVGDPVAGPH